MKFFCKICLFLLLFLAKTVVLSAGTDCAGYKPSYPEHYCECKNNTKHLGKLPFDVMVTDSIWFDCSSNLFTKGFTAYLYSDCDVNFDIYQNCTSSEPLYSVVIPKNQARDVSAESIKQKLESMGMSGSSMAIFLCIYPVGGVGGRLMCYPYNTGYNSTCSDILSLLPGMTFVSSQTENVYEIMSENIADSYAMYLQWSEENGAGCDLEITRGNCEGEVIAEYSFTAEGDVFVLDAELLMDVRANGESLFAHFSHDASAVGRVNFNEAAFVDVLTDTVICKGKEFRYGKYTTTESGVYRYDTVKVSDVKYVVKGYNVMFAEPEVQYDSIVLRNNQLPYNYRGEMIEAFGNYDLRLVADGECDEHILLNVRHNLMATTVVIDTTICYGGRFEYGGNSYLHDVRLVDSIWSDTRDTLTLNIINVYFNTQNFVYDTLALTKEESKLYRYKGTTIKGFGDYEIDTYDEHNCAVKLYLHVCHKMTNIKETVDTILCDGEVYKHIDGVEYRTSVVLVDSSWVDDDTYRVATTNVRFITNELTYDTLYLGYADLPYIYKEQVLIREMRDTTVAILFGKCTGQVLLHLVHKYETVMEEEDITLCEGKIYVHNGVEYRKAVTVVDSLWANEDKFVIKTIRVNFTAPEVAYDTIALRASELPFLYREQYLVSVDGFGDHEVTIINEGECDERIALHVKHRTDRMIATKDTTLCEGKGYEYGGEWYYEPVVLVDSVWTNRDTMLVTTTLVNFVAPEMQYDTIGLRCSELPYMYRGQYNVADFGSHDVIIREDGECDELYRIFIYHKIDTIVMVKDSLICFGGRYQYEKDGKQYIARADISFGSQTVLNADTVILDSLHVRFAKVAEVVYDTILVTTADLAKGYKYDIYNQTIKRAGDYQWEGQTNTVTKCKENVYLHVVELAEEMVDVIVCEGKGYEHKAAWYYESVVLVDSAWVNELKYLVTTTRVYFTAPEVAYDTLVIRASELPYTYRGEQVADFGEYDLLIRRAGECDERVKLNVQHLVTTIREEKDTTLCQGKGYEHNGAIYSEAATIIDSLWMNRDTFLIATTRVYFAAPEIGYDTLVIRVSELPYTYRGEQVADFGEYDLTIRKAGECDERVKLKVQHLVTTIREEKDTTLCEGKGYEHNGVEYFETTTIVDSLWINRDTILITTIKVEFAAPEVEYDTVLVREADLQSGYYYELADVYIYAVGVYDYEITADGECTRKISLTVEKDIPSLIDEVVEEEKPKLIMIDGVIYIFYNGEYYTLLGARAMRD